MVLESKNYRDRRVLIKRSDKYPIAIIGTHGTVTRVSGNSIGVFIDGFNNKASNYGVYWFDRYDLEIIENESEDMKMKGFNHVAVVNLLEDSYKKDYAFALYDEDLKLITNDNVMVVVNARGKDKRVLGIVKDIMTVETYYSIDKNRGTNITAEVVGVVNMDGYIAREEEKVRLKELAKKKAAIEMELEAEINKRKSVEYYEEMAKKYSDNPKLAELVAELKGLGT